MSVRFVSTPLAAPLHWPEPRDGIPTSQLDAAVVRPAMDVPAWERARQLLQATGTLVVTTGQQPGLFTGPLYTIHKALSASALCQLLERRWARSVVPVFWVAGDDHDFAEASGAAWLGPDGSVVTRTLRERPTEAPLTPMYLERLGPEVATALADLAAALPASEFRDATLEWLGRHFKPEATVAGAFATALAELLAPFGILCLSSSDRPVKIAMAPLLLRALELAPALEQDLGQRAGELASLGSDPGVAPAEGATLVMLEGRLGRDRLVRDGNSFVTRRGGERFTLTQLGHIAAGSPERLSPNALLRPVVERALLPTVAYVGGPGELRYLQLTPPVYQRLGVPRQLPVPRWSGLLVEPRVDRVLEKFGATVEELLLHGMALEARVLRSQLPAEVTRALTTLREVLEREYGIVAKGAAEIDPTIERPVQATLHQAVAGTHEVEKRLLHHLTKRGETEIGQIRRARTALLPLGKPQERVLTVAPFLSRHGLGLLQELQASILGWYQDALEGAPLPS